MHKLPGVKCSHCSLGQGCHIYNTRPNVCRDYYCLWRSLPEMDDSWRPDLSGIMMIPIDTPPPLGTHFGVTLILTGAPEILRSEKFAGMLAGFVESGTAVYLDVPQGIGYYSHRAFLNDRLNHAISIRDLAAVQALIWGCYQALVAKEPVKLSGDEVTASNTIPPLHQ